MADLTHIKGLLFDKDGTLFDFTKTWGGWCKNVVLAMADQDEAEARRLGALVGFDYDTITFAQGASIIGETIDDTKAKWLAGAPHLTSATLDEMDAAARIASPDVPVGDLQALFKELRDLGLPLGIATNDSEARAHITLERHDLTSFFSPISGYDSVVNAKPAGDMVHRFAQAHGLAVDQVAMIGDSLHDIHAGRDAGAFCVGVLTGPATADYLAPHCDLLIDDITLLPNLLK